MFLRWKIRFFTKRRGATGLKSLDVDCEKHWIGWPGVCVEQKTEKDDICSQLEKNNYHPVFLSDEQYKNYYEGYSNSTLWPLCHYFFAYTLYKKTFGNHIGKSMLFFVKRYLE